MIITAEVGLDGGGTTHSAVGTLTIPKRLTTGNGLRRYSKEAAPGV
jgi:hypothetical protein